MISGCTIAALRRPKPPYTEFDVELFLSGIVVVYVSVLLIL